MRRPWFRADPGPVRKHIRAPRRRGTPASPAADRRLPWYIPDLSRRSSCRMYNRSRPIIRWIPSGLAGIVVVEQKLRLLGQDRLAVLVVAVVFLRRSRPLAPAECHIRLQRRPARSPGRRRSRCRYCSHWRAGSREPHASAGRSARYRGLPARVLGGRDPLRIRRNASSCARAGTPNHQALVETSAAASITISLRRLISKR